MQYILVAGVALVMTFSRNAQDGIIYTVFSVAVLMLVFLIARLGVNIPWGDEWDQLIFINNTLTSGLDLSSLFSQHNEHRIAVIRLIMLANAQLFSLNLKLQMYLTGCCLAWASYICIVNHQKICQERFRWLAVASPLLLCNYRHYENLLWGFQVGFVLSLVLPVVTFHLLGHHRETPWKTVAALICAVTASFSSIQGLFVWPAALVMLALSEKGRGRNLILWGVTGLLVWGAYFLGYSRASGHPPLEFAWEHPFDAIRFLCTLIGNLIPWRENVSLVFGAAVLTVFVGLVLAVFLRNRLVEFRFWLAVGLFAFMSLLAVTLGRSGLGIESAFASRYVSVSALFLVAVVAIFSGVLRTGSEGYGSIPLYAMSLLLIIAVPFAGLHGWRSGNFMHDKFVQMRFLLRNYRIVPPAAIQYLYLPNGSVPIERAPLLEKFGHEIFSSGDKQGI